MAKVKGIPHTLTVLAGTEIAMNKASRTAVQPVARQVVATMKAMAPNRVLSNIEPEPVRALYRTEGRVRNPEHYVIVKFYLAGPKWTVVADMARQVRLSPTFTPNLEMRYGSASRWAWPSVERHREALIGAVAAASLAVQRASTGELKGMP